ncbi:MAG: phosphoadenosine phosphosulfate reductase family protein, partial [Chloroflexaceae bacterium]
MSVNPDRSTPWSAAELAELNARFRDRPPEELLAWAAGRFGEQTVLTCSFGGASGMVLLDLIARQRLPITILFLDTDLLFPETYHLAAEVERRYGLAVRRQRPALSLEEQARQHGPEL